MERRGRPSKWDKIKGRLSTVSRMRANGATKQQIADFFDIHIDTLISYEKKYPEFSEALKRGQKKQIDSIKGVLYELAMGGTVKTEVTSIEEILDADGNIIGSKRKITEKVLPPNPYAANLLLANLDPDWHNDPKMLKIRQEEMELRKKKAENDW